ncbi:hypothetical protein [Clostridium sp. CCUG 7971]|uniref:hypothetical protein n=1 Tax=Clostridium sp. CCUG 7971 TaxID=2811414 RepID=UPI001ABA2900|nr:hypothetical protein [Clostridium sp. CCUG 7971]MBO3444688.1 hypothetical protein [Clostridium sp. CCUG 7971]
MNKREKVLSFILISLLFGVIISKFITTPMNSEIVSLNNSKEKILESKNTEKNYKINEEDIILKIEKELNEILTINSINKISSWNEDSIEEENIEINVSGSLENLFKIEGKIEILGFKDKLKDIKIIKNNVNHEENNVDCTMLFKVG